MKTYKVYYHTHEIIFEADNVVGHDDRNVFFKNENLIAVVPLSCPFTIIKAEWKVKY
jgi:hypothetical protein